MELLRQGYRVQFSSGAGRTHFFSAAEDALQMLHDRGFTMAVATGKSRRGLDQEFDLLLRGRNWFATTRTADCTKSKPDPQMLLECMEEVGSAADSTLMIGDSLIDLKMAAAAGVRSIAVSFGAEAREDLLTGMPEFCADDWPALLAYIEHNFEPLVDAAPGGVEALPGS